MLLYFYRYDSNHTDSESEAGSGAGSDDSKKKEKKSKEKKEKKHKSAKTVVRYLLCKQFYTYITNIFMCIVWKTTQETVNKREGQQ